MQQRAISIDDIKVKIVRKILTYIRLYTVNLNYSTFNESSKLYNYFGFKAFLILNAAIECSIE